jgi:1,4-dihydroxy-2-naphthoate octaprenyltransferase
MSPIFISEKSIVSPIYVCYTWAMAEDARPSRLKKWIIAARPWAFPASTMPVVFGTALAVVVGGARFSPLRFVWALATMVVLHAAANMLSDVYDFRHGLDRDVTPVSGAVVRGWLTDKQVFLGAAGLFALGGISGLALAAVTGRSLFIIGGIGLLVGVFYTLLKPRALGDLAVFLDFGLLGAAGAWVVQTGTFSWLPVIWTVPMAMLVIAILHANNWRDISSDGERRVVTVAGRLGDRGALVYFGLLIFGPFLIDLAFVAVPRIAGGPLRPMPLTFGLVLLALPNALKLWGRALRRAAPRHPMDFVILDGATASHNLVFGLLSTAAVVLEGLLRWG